MLHAMIRSDIYPTSEVTHLWPTHNVICYCTEWIFDFTAAQKLQYSVDNLSGFITIT